MAFHEVQFPTGLSYGSRGGPQFKTDIVVADSGREERVSRWEGPRWTFNPAWALKSSSDMYSLQEFYVAREGSAHGFRYKDWFDFSSASDGVGTVDDEDQLLGYGDGSETQFQLRKAYASGSATRYRNITKPVSGTVVVSVNSVAQTEGVDFTVNTTNGLITFSSAPANGATIKAGFQFDVPVRFDIGDELLELSYDFFDTGSIPDIPLIELVGEEALADDYPYRGAKAHGSIAADVSITTLDGLVHSATPTAANVDIVLPGQTNLPYGGPYFYVLNYSGSQTLGVREASADGGSLVGTLGTNTGGAVLMGKTTGGAKEWVLV